MNKKRRGNLKQALDLINAAGDIIQNALYEEQDCLDNLPENLMESDRYSKMESTVDELEQAIDYIENIKNSVEEALL